ncbi:MAG: DUF5005 domain-containing protein [Prevotellaceae bacterium]|nr:DUF5005 domain-containing protein [Prevotellaceae bacterium]
MVTRKIYMTMLAAGMMAASGYSQNFDFYQDGLKDLYLDYESQLSSKTTTEVFRDVTYWNMFGMRQKGWNGGLKTVSMPLPDGNCLWLHADSYFGRISEVRDRAHYNNRVHNAAQIQIGESSPRDFVSVNEYIGTDQNYPSTYYMAYDLIRHPEAKASMADLELGDVDQDHYLRPLDGTLIKWDGKPHAQIIFLSYNSNDEADGMYVAEYSIDGSPTDAGYMQLLSLTKMPYVTDFGYSILEDGDYLYLYGNVPTSETGFDAVIARVQGRSLLGKWEYYVTNANGIRQWQTELPTIDQLKKSKINGVGKTRYPSAFKYGDNYYLVSQVSAGNQIQLSKGDNPWGPFKSQVKLYMPKSAENVVCHVAVHPHMSRIGELVVSYSTDIAPTTVYSATKAGEPIVERYLTTDERNRYGWGSANLSVPHFLRIFNWQGLIQVDNIGKMTDPGLDTWDVIDGIETQKTGKFNVYPTIAKDVVNIETGVDKAMSWNICSANGSLIMQGDVRGTAQVHIGNLSKGVYLVNVGELGTIKVVKN